MNGFALLWHIPANGILFRQTSNPKSYGELDPNKTNWVGGGLWLSHCMVWLTAALTGLSMSAKAACIAASHTGYKPLRRWHSRARHALITSCMRAYAPCQTVDRPSL